MTRYPLSRRRALLAILLLGATFVLMGVFYAASTPRAWGETLSFGRGLPVQQVDPAGRNSVQFMAHAAPLTATLQLYTLSTSQFISTYNSLPGDYWEDWYLDPAGLPLAAQWQVGVTDPYEMQETPLPGLPSGFYLLALGDGVAVQDELLVVLSRDVLLLKASASGDVTRVVAWASRLSTSAPLSGVAVTLYDDQGQAQASGLTDAGGLYVAELPGADPNALVAVGATPGGEWTACGTRREWNSDARAPWSWSPPTPHTPAHQVYLYTDRPIYRPGHAVFYKGILRHDDDGDYAPITATQSITLAVRDARDNVLSTATLFPSDFGTISGTFTLADEAGLGDYYLEVTLDGATYRQPFKVEAYRKPEYEVTVGTPADYYVQGDLFTVTVTADYYFGQPVAGAALQFGLYQDFGYYGGEYLMWETSGATDAQGRWTTVINTADYASGDTIFFTFHATVSDESQQYVSGERRVPVYNAAYTLAVSMDQYGYQPGETVTATVQARDHDDAPVVGVPLTVTVSKWTSGQYQPVISLPGTTDGVGEARVVFDVSTTGWYQLLAQGLDGRGRTVSASRWFWVYQDGWGWSGDPDDAVSISADQESYAPGEVAQLLVRSPVTGTALLSLERGRVRRVYPLLLTDTVSLVSLPIQADDAPNVFVTLGVFERGWEPGDDYYSYRETTPEGRLLLASAELVVPAADQVLQVELLPDRTTCNPRETVTFTVQVRDQGGDPVVAEVSLGLVDEAIYALSEDLSADIHATFYGRREHDVSTFDSLRPRRYDWVYAAGPAPTGTPSPTAPAPPGDAGAREGVRRDFRDTAYWHPGVVTDAAGRAVVSFTLPDNLTRWRALARAVSRDTKVGEATTFITVTQELIVRPVLPRFLIQGDVARLRTIAHNYLPSGDEVMATLTLSASGLVLLGADCGATACLPLPLTLPPGGTATSDRVAVASELGTGRVLARLQAGVGASAGLTAGGDAVELPLPIYPFAVPELTSRVGQVEHEITETLYLSTTAMPDATRLEIRLSSSIALGLLDGLEYLISYPFG
jgi:uncharacterized protein YfaS (alpha-2-macroglobulin family)